EDEVADDLYVREPSPGDGLPVDYACGVHQQPFRVTVPSPAMSQTVTPGVSGRAAVAAPARTICPGARGMRRLRQMSRRACRAARGAPRIAAVDPTASAREVRSRTALFATSVSGCQEPT